MQKNVLDRRVWDTRESLRVAIVTWIERTYHRRRRQVRLRRLTPVEYETMMSVTTTSAAGRNETRAPLSVYWTLVRRDTVATKGFTSWRFSN